MMLNIRCAICCRQVDEVLFYKLDMHNEFVIKAKCHGETEEMRFSALKYSRRELEALLMSDGVAFTTKRLEGPTGLPGASIWPGIPAPVEPDYPQHLMSDSRSHLGPEVAK